MIVFSVVVSREIIFVWQYKSDNTAVIVDHCMLMRTGYDKKLLY